MWWKIFCDLEENTIEIKWIKKVTVDVTIQF